MKSLDRYEREMLGAYEKGVLVSVRPSKAQVAAFRDAARATFVKSRREKRSRLTAASTATARKRAAR